MATENVKADPTFIGYFVIALFLLILGVYLLEAGCVFGDVLPQTPEAAEKTLNLPVGTEVMEIMSLVFAAALAGIAVLAYKAGNKSSTAIFGIFAFIMMAYSRIYLATRLDSTDVSYLSNADYQTTYGWFFYILLAVLLVIVVLYLLMEQESKIAALLLVMLAAVLVLMAVDAALSSDLVWGQYNNGYVIKEVVKAGDVAAIKIVSIIGGALSLVAFVIATYLGFAYGLPRKKLPVL